MTSSHEPDSYRLKLDRGDQHTRTLAESIDDWKRSGGLDFIRRSSADKLSHEVHLRSDPLPAEWSLMIGDAVQNIRNALDHLVFALTEKALGRPLTEKEERATEFPVERLSPIDATRQRRAMGHLPQLAQDFIMSMQPTAVGSRPKSLLWNLHEISNRDKHRTVTTSLVTMTGIGILDPMTSIDLLKAPGVEVADGDLLCRYTTLAPPPGPLRAIADVEVTFGAGQPLYGRPVVPTLCEFRDFAEAVGGRVRGLAAAT